MTTTILCTDGSELAIAAIKAGLAVLVPADRTVLVTVVDYMDVAVIAGAAGLPSSVTMGTPAYDADLMEARRRAARSALAETIDALGVDGDDIEAIVLDGSPGPTVCDYAEEIGATTIVIGSRGRSGFKRAVLGSVSDHVVRHAPCPVLISSN